MIRTQLRQKRAFTGTEGWWLCSKVGWKLPKERFKQSGWVKGSREDFLKDIALEVLLKRVQKTSVGEIGRWHSRWKKWSGQRDRGEGYNMDKTLSPTYYCFLCTKHCAKQSRCITSFNLDNKPMRQDSIIVPILQMRKHRPKRLCRSSNVTQLWSGRAGFWTWAYLSSESMHTTNQWTICKSGHGKAW